MYMTSNKLYDNKLNKNKRNLRRKKIRTPKKEDSIPNMVANYVMRKISLWLGVNHNR
jgi:hypothetical protein